VLWDYILSFVLLFLVSLVSEWRRYEQVCIWLDLLVCKIYNCAVVDVERLLFRGEMICMYVLEQCLFVCVCNGV